MIDFINEFFLTEYRYCPKDVRLKKKARKEARNRKSKNESESSSKRAKKGYFLKIYFYIFFDSLMFF